MEFRSTGNAEYVALFLDSAESAASAAETFYPRIVVKRDTDEELFRERRPIGVV